MSNYNSVMKVSAIDGETMLETLSQHEKSDLFAMFIKKKSK